MPRSFRCSTLPVGVFRSIGEPTREVVVLRVAFATKAPFRPELRRRRRAAFLPLEVDHLADVRLDAGDADAAAERLRLAGADAAHDERRRERWSSAFSEAIDVGVKPFCDVSA